MDSKQHEYSCIKHREKRNKEPFISHDFRIWSIAMKATPLNPIPTLSLSVSLPPSHFPPIPPSFLLSFFLFSPTNPIYLFNLLVFHLKI